MVSFTRRRRRRDWTGRVCPGCDRFLPANRTIRSRCLSGRCAKRTISCGRQMRQHFGCSGAIRLPTTSNTRLYGRASNLPRWLCVATGRLPQIWSGAIRSGNRPNQFHATCDQSVLSLTAWPNFRLRRPDQGWFCPQRFHRHPQN